jgi:hypothetical protein
MSAPIVYNIFQMVEDLYCSRNSPNKVFSQSASYEEISTVCDIYHLYTGFYFNPMKSREDVNDNYLIISVICGFDGKRNLIVIPVLNDPDDIKYSRMYFMNSIIYPDLGDTSMYCASPVKMSDIKNTKTMYNVIRFSIHTPVKKSYYFTSYELSLYILMAIVSVKLFHEDRKLSDEDYAFIRDEYSCELKNIQYSYHGMKLRYENEIKDMTPIDNWFNDYFDQILYKKISNLNFNDFKCSYNRMRDIAFNHGNVFLNNRDFEKLIEAEKEKEESH